MFDTVCVQYFADTVLSIPIIYKTVPLSNEWMNLLAVWWLILVHSLPTQQLNEP